MPLLTPTPSASDFVQIEAHLSGEKALQLD